MNPIRKREEDLARKLFKKMTYVERLVLSIVKANPNRLFEHGGTSPRTKITADDVIGVKIRKDESGRAHNIMFFFDESSDSVRGVYNEHPTPQYRSTSMQRSSMQRTILISRAISYTNIPCGFLYINSGYLNNNCRSVDDYVCMMANKFLKIDAQTLKEVELNLALMGILPPQVSEQQTV